MRGGWNGSCGRKASPYKTITSGRLSMVFRKWKAASYSKPALEIQWNLGFDVSKYILRLTHPKSKSPTPCLLDPWLSIGDFSQGSEFSLLCNSATPTVISDWDQITDWRLLLGPDIQHSLSFVFRSWISVKTQPWRSSDFHRVLQIDTWLSWVCHFLPLWLLWLLITANQLHIP